MTPNRKNNFDILRLLFATFVVISHSYWINGEYPQEILNFATHQQIDLGALGVKGFFVISGFLVFKSLERSQNLIQYFGKRLLRLYPALLGMCLFIACVLPFVSEISLFKNTNYWTLSPKILQLFHDHITLNGVFENHPKKEINMSLWTLPYEFVCYVFLGLLFFVKNKRIRLFILIFSFVITWYLSCFRYLWLNERIFHYFHFKSYYFYDLTCFFSAGAILSYVNFSKVKYRFLHVFIGISILILSLTFQNFLYFKYFLIPIIVLLIGTYQGGFLNIISKKIGDISYGVYIYGWFIQQCLWHFFKFEVWILTFVSLPIIYLLGWISWIFIEKKALRLKTKL